jgi:hypothetical protein
MTSSRLLQLERLEDRCVPAIYGNPWPNGAALTLSFVPDGTQVNNSTSSLFHLLDHTMPVAVWQHDIVRAFQTWAVQANLNMSVVADSGDPLGTQGLIQGDPRFGDIRVSARPMSAGVVAEGTPFNLTAGTWSGDLVLNSNYQFGSGEDQYDLTTVALHEAGHVFGLDDSLDTSSVMYESYQGVRTTLGASDISQIQALYGARRPDSYEGATGNNTMATAAYLPLAAAASNGSVNVVANADITTFGQADYFRVTTPLSVGLLQVQLQTSRISSLDATVTIYNAAGQVIATAQASDPFQGDLTLTLNQGISALSDYYVEVQGATQDAFGIGSYQLTISALPLVNGLTTSATGTGQTTTTQVANTVSLNHSFLTALPVLTTFNQVDANYDYAYQATITSANQADYYSVQAPSAAVNPATATLSVMVWGTQSGGLIPTATIYNATQNALAPAVLVHEGNFLVLQLANATPGATYYVVVQAANPNGPNNLGAYFLGVDFGQKPTNMDNIATGQLLPTQTSQDGWLTMNQAGLFHFALAAQAAGPVDVCMTIYNSAGQAVFVLNTQDGQTWTDQVYLNAGTYHVQFTLLAVGSNPLPPTTFDLLGMVLGDPIGTQPSDPYSQPSSSGNTTSSSNSTTSSSTTSNSTYNYSNSNPYNNPNPSS